MYIDNITTKDKDAAAIRLTFEHTSQNFTIFIKRRAKPQQHHRQMDSTPETREHTHQPPPPPPPPRNQHKEPRSTRRQETQQPRTIATTEETIKSIQRQISELGHIPRGYRNEQKRSLEVQLRHQHALLLQLSEQTEEPCSNHTETLRHSAPANTALTKRTMYKN